MQIDETATAVKVALVVNTLLLGLVGWNMGRAGGLRGARLLASSCITALFGVVMIVLKTTLH